MLKLTSVFWIVVMIEGKSQVVLKSEDKRPLCACGFNAHSLQKRIVGGHNAGHGHFPYASQLLFAGQLDDAWRAEQFENAFCGGTLITDLHVLTAAHCVKNKGAEDILIAIGNPSVKNTSEVQLRKAESIIKYPDYKPNSFHSDIAIIQLERPVSWDSGILAAWLPPTNLPLVPGTTVAVYGWGRVSYNESGHPDTLQVVDLPIVDSRVCQKKFKTHIEKKMLCAGGVKGQDACIGDSGSGLVIRLDKQIVLCGVVSFGKRCGLPHVAGVYTRVSPYIDWIYANTLSGLCRPCIYGSE